IIERNHWTLPQERYNADWVEEQKVGISLRNFKKEITGAVGRMLDSATRCEFVKHVKRPDAEAFYEVDVAGIEVVEVARDISRVAVRGVAGDVGEGVPDRNSAATLVDGAFNLTGGDSAAPEEVSGKA